MPSTTELDLIGNSVCCHMIGTEVKRNLFHFILSLFDITTKTKCVFKVLELEITTFEFIGKKYLNNFI